MKKKPFLMLVGGGSGSGKSTIVELICKKCPKDEITVLAQDHYYKDLSHLSAPERDLVNFDNPEAIDHKLLYSHLKLLCQNKAVDRPSYDFASHTRHQKTKKLSPKSIIILDGIFSLYFEKIRQLADVSIFVDVPDDLRFIRRLQRDMTRRARSQSSVIKQYLESVRLMHNSYVEPTKNFADLVIYWEKENPQATKQLVSMLLHKL